MNTINRTIDNTSFGYNEARIEELRQKLFPNLYKHENKKPINIGDPFKLLKDTPKSEESANIDIIDTKLLTNINDKKYLYKVPKIKTLSKKDNKPVGKFAAERDETIHRDYTKVNRYTTIDLRKCPECSYTGKYSVCIEHWFKWGRFMPTELIKAYR